MERKRDLGVFTVSESMVSGKRYPTVRVRERGYVDQAID